MRGEEIWCRGGSGRVQEKRKKVRGREKEELSGGGRKEE